MGELEVAGRGSGAAADPPPFLGVPPALDVYRKLGHRRLAARTYATAHRGRDD